MARSPTVRSPSDAPRSPEAVAALLRDLGPRLRRGGGPDDDRPPLATGIEAVDRLTGGGFPRGRLSEIAGPLSSGRTSLALALLARLTREGELAAVIDAADAFDPASAEAADVDLERVLWVRAPELRGALRSTERLLEARGFGLVLLDLVTVARPPAPVVWQRLARAAAAADSAVVLLSATRMAGTHAELAVETRLSRTRFRGTPALLEQLESEVELVRSRNAPAVRAVSVRLHSTRAA